jgi:hypothetical protein
MLTGSQIKERQTLHSKVVDKVCLRLAKSRASSGLDMTFESNERPNPVIPAVTCQRLVCTDFAYAVKKFETAEGTGARADSN